MEILNLSQEKEKEIIIIRTKLTYYKVFHITFIRNKIRKTQTLMNKPLYLGLSIWVINVSPV